MALRIEVNNWNYSSKPANCPAQTNASGEEDELRQMQKETFAWIAASAQSKFRKAWSAAREPSIEHD